MQRLTRNYKKCVICQVRRTPGSRVFLARLPLDAQRCRMWVKAIGLEDLVHVPIEKLHELKFVCDLHFANEDMNDSRSRLLKHAVPTLLLPNEPLPDDMLQDFPFHICQCAISTKVVLKDVTNLSASSTPVTTESVSLDLSGVAGPSSENLITVHSHKRLQDVTNLSASSTSVTTESVSLDLSGVAGPSSENLITVHSHKRTRKSTESKVSTFNTREEKLLQQLKAANINLKKLARTSVDLDRLDNETLKKLVEDAVKNHGKKPAGKRWTLKTKLWALTIFKRSPKAYRCLGHAIPVPSVKTLQRVLQGIPLEPGINKDMLLKMKESVCSLSDNDKYCAILFDEISLKKRLVYNEGTDRIEGFEDLGADQRSLKIADHALVFMVQGLRKKFKQPVAYYFVQGTISSTKLSCLVKEICVAIEEINLNVVTTVCDQGPTNMGALNLLKKFGGQSPDDNFFIFNQKKIFIIYDIPHLFKSIRNNFYNAGEIDFDGITGKWCHLILAEEQNRNFLNFNKLSKSVVHPTYKIKMRVKYAARALSNTMSAILKMLAWKHINSEEIGNTAEVVGQLDKLFDICNGPSSPQDVKKGIRENVSSTSNHVAMWRHFISKIDKIKFVKSDSRLILNHVRCIKGFKISLKSLHDIWHQLEKCGFHYMNLRQLNQDSLENLFGVIRQHSPTNRNPTSSLFVAALKTSIISGLTAPHNRGSNCEADTNILFFNYKKDFNSIIISDETVSDSHNVVQNVAVLSLPEHIVLAETDLCSFEDQPVVYVSGFLASKLLRGNDCHECRNCLTNENSEAEMYKYISYREWWKDKKSLTYPSNGLCETVNTAKTVFENDNIKSQIYKPNIREICIFQFIVYCDLSWFTCNRHELPEKLFKNISELFLRKYCRIRNEEFSNVENQTADSYKKSQQMSTAK